MRIDVHAHAMPRDYVKILLDTGPYGAERGPDEQIILHQGGARFLTILPQMLDPELRLAEMDAAGIDYQVLSVPTPQVYFRSGDDAVSLAQLCNDYLADVVAQYPHRFGALASIPFTAGVDASINELARCMDNLAMQGFLIGANIDGAPIDDPRLDPFFEEANRRGAAMLIHPMVPPGIESMNRYALGPLIGANMDTTLAVARLIYSDFFGRFLGINVIVPYLGAAIPYLAGQLDYGWQHFPECQTITRAPSEVIERLYVDTVNACEPALKCAIEVLGEERILYGSDYPNESGYACNGIETIERVVGRRHRSRVLAGTAAELFRLTLPG